MEAWERLPFPQRKLWFPNYIVGHWWVIKSVPWVKTRVFLLTE